MHVERAEARPRVHDEVGELLDGLGRVRWRVGLEGALLIGLRGAVGSGLAFAGLSVAGWLTEDSGPAGVAWLAAAPLVVALAVAVARWPTLHQAAVAADDRLGLAERLGTAVELVPGLASQNGRTGRFDRLQVRDALDQLARAPDGFALRFPPATFRAASLAAVSLALALATAVWVPRLPRPGLPGVDQSAPGETPLAAGADDAPLAQDAADAQPAVEAAANPPAQPDAALASRVQQEQAERDALDTLSQALGRVSAAQPAADAIQQGDFSAAANQLSTLGEEADQLSDAAKQQLSKALQQAASQTTTADRQLADRERRAAQALGRPNSYAEQRQALHDLGDQVQRSGAHSAPSDQLERDLGQLQQQLGAGQTQGQAAGSPDQGNAGQQQTSAAQPGAGVGVSQGAGTADRSGAPGIGTGASSDLLADQPAHLDSAGQTVQVPVKLGQGPGVRPPDGTEDRTGGDPTSGATSVSELIQAQRTGQVAPEQNLVPGEQRPLVRDYFR